MRTPEDILRDLRATRTGRPRRVNRTRRPRKDLPRPQNKRVRGSLVHDSKAQVTEAFAEADRRDRVRFPS